MHFLYIDEAGDSGLNLLEAEQPVFCMAGVIVSDEKWKATREKINEVLEAALGEKPEAGFELHACELLSPNGDGPFEGWDRAKRNKLALDLLDILEERGHHVLIHWIHKSKLEALANLPDLGLNWKNPWEHSYHALLTMFEAHLKGSATGSSSTGLVIADHSDTALDLVRDVSASRRELTGWRKISKIVEIGYSAESHANRLIQMADLVAFTMKKWAESQTDFADQWPAPAKTFFSDCRKKVWSRTKLKTITSKKLKINANYRSSLLDCRKRD